PRSSREEGRMRLSRVCVLLVVVSGMVLASRAGVAQMCSPTCAAGQACVNGACVAAAPASPPAAVVPAAPAPPLWHEGKTVVPFAGINSFVGDRATNLGVGIRLGTLLGSRVSERWSLNVELAFDFVNADSPPGVTDRGYVLDLAFAPLLHFP